MGYSDVFFSANEQLQLRDFFRISKEIFEQVNTRYWNKEYQSMSFEEWKNLLTEHGYDVNKIMVDYKQRVFYIGEYSAVDLQSLDPSWLTNPLTVQSTNKEEFVKKEFLNGEYFSTFFPEWNSFAIDFFIKLHKQIDISKVWENFKIVYTYSEYGFSMFPREVIDYCVAYADNKESLEKLKKLSVIDEDGYITIYRGMADRSTPLEKAYSWTLSKEIANRFANKLSRGNGTIYKAKVKLENVIDYDNDRNEQEVLVRFEHIENLEKLVLFVEE